MMGEQAADLRRVVTRYISRYFEAPEEEITPTTCLVERFNNTNPDLFSDFLADFAREFSVALPKIDNPGRFLREQFAEHGLKISDLVRAWTRQPQIFIRSITVNDLCDIAVRGAWATNDERG